MFKKLVDLFFQYEKLKIYPDDMRAILSYQERINRCPLPDSESSAGPVSRIHFMKIYNGRREKFNYETPCTSIPSN
jgi:hypothetical protein